MKNFVCLVAACALIGLCATQAAPSAKIESDFQLTIELRDGSRIVGRNMEDALSLHSETLGDMKLPWGSIRSIKCPADAGAARLTATNGDEFTVQIATDTLRVKTEFGTTKLPVKLIRSATVSAVMRAGQLPSGLVALWSGEGNGTDLISGNEAALMDISFVEGQVGRAFSFNGTTSCIKIPANPSLDLGAGEGLTVSAWIKPSDIEGLHPMIQWSDNNPLNLWIGIRPYENGVLRGDITDARGNHFVASYPGTLVAGVFQHVAFTYDKTTGMGILYLNGVVVAKRQIGARLVALTKGDLWISQPDHRPGNWSTGRMFEGAIDEIALYNRALSATEIQAICEEQCNSEPLIAPTPSTGWVEDWMR